MEILGIDVKQAKPTGKSAILGFGIKMAGKCAGSLHLNCIQALCQARST
jgi:hypothetical protein